MVWTRVVLVMFMCSEGRKALPTPLNKSWTAAQEPVTRLWCERQRFPIQWEIIRHSEALWALSTCPYRPVTKKQKLNWTHLDGSSINRRIRKLLDFCSKRKKKKNKIVHASNRKNYNLKKVTLHPNPFSLPIYVLLSSNIYHSFPKLFSFEIHWPLHRCRKATDRLL